MNGLCYILLLALVMYHVQSQDGETRTRPPRRHRVRVTRGPRPSRLPESTTTMTTTQQSEVQSYSEDDFISLNEDGSLSCTEDKDCPDYSFAPDELVSHVRTVERRSGVDTCRSRIKCNSR